MRPVPPATLAEPDPGAWSGLRAEEALEWLREYAGERLNSQLIDERRCIPPHVVLDLGNRGLMGLQVPEADGGLGLGHRDAMRVVEQLAAIDLSLATFLVLHNFLGIRPIQRHAAPAVRDELVPVLARGRELAAFALTEPGAGSNPQAMAATAAAQPGGGWRLRGEKVWSGSASWAGVLNVFARAAGPDGRPCGVTGFVVRAGTPGLRHGAEALTMGMRGMVQSAVRLDDAPVADGDVLGRVGAGMAVAQDAMTFTRLAIGAESLGAMKRCLQLMHRYASRRTVATGCLLDNPVTLARLNGLTAAVSGLEALVDRICRTLDAGRPVPAEAFMTCKVAGSERLWEAADGLVQLLGGRGYVESNEAPRLLRDARVFRIFEGPTETLQLWLGLRVLHQGAELQQYLAGELGVPAAAERLREAARLIAERRAGAGADASAVNGSRRACSTIGEVAIHAVLWAAAQASLRDAPSPQAARAEAWLGREFERALARALEDGPRAAEALDAEAATAVIAGYAGAIGDVEQRLPGADGALDAMLRR